MTDSSDECAHWHRLTESNTSQRGGFYSTSDPLDLTLSFGHPVLIKAQGHSFGHVILPASQLWFGELIVCNKIYI